MKARPPIYWKTLAVAGPGLALGVVFLVVAGFPWLALAAVLVAAVLFFVPWLLSPYSKGARRMAWPSPDETTWGERTADRLGAIPVFGALWRFAERLTGDADRKATEDYRRWQREHDDDWHAP